MVYALLASVVFAAEPPAPTVVPPAPPALEKPARVCLVRSDADALVVPLSIGRRPAGKKPFAELGPGEILRLEVVPPIANDSDLVDVAAPGMSNDFTIYTVAGGTHLFAVAVDRDVAPGKPIVHFDSIDERKASPELTRCEQAPVTPLR